MDSGAGSMPHFGLAWNWQHNTDGANLLLHNHDANFLLPLFKGAQFDCVQVTVEDIWLVRAAGVLSCYRDQFEMIQTVLSSCWKKAHYGDKGMDGVSNWYQRAPSVQRNGSHTNATGSKLNCALSLDDPSSLDASAELLSHRLICGCSSPSFAVAQLPSCFKVPSVASTRHLGNREPDSTCVLFFFSHSSGRGITSAVMNKRGLIHVRFLIPLSRKSQYISSMYDESLQSPFSSLFDNLLELQQLISIMSTCLSVLLIIKTATMLL